jgi:chorismate lyase / 3-hydroxybenzoate synthase
MSLSVRENMQQGKKLSSTGERVLEGDFDLSKHWAADGSAADLPAWTSVFIGDDAVDLALECESGIRAFERKSGDWTIRTVVVPAACLMQGQDFERATHQAYRRLLLGIPHGHLLRIWNYVPRINDAVEDDLEAAVPRNRYMAFNAGRFQSFQEVYERPEWFPVASGVGHAGDDLVLHLLHGDGLPRPVDNPRQVLPVDYSEKFGDLPPAFVRAATIQSDAGEYILVSGTASVVGEDSAHVEDFDRQLEETLDNLAMVVDACRAGFTPVHLDHWLVYLLDATQRGKVLAAVERRWPGHQVEIEFRVQKLCRPELLVEIECAGLATAAERDA